MAQFPVIAPQTGAIADKSKRVNVNAGQEVQLTASGLATTETMTPYVGGPNGAWTAIFDSSGAQVKLTATKPQLSLPGGCHYAIDKDATAGAAGLDASITYNTP